MTSNRPYLLRALNEWLIDNDQTPHLIVSTKNEHQVLPMQFADNDQIVLNISPSAVMNLHMGNEWISFNARFAGQPMDVMIYVGAVLGIYAKETGQGMTFVEEEMLTEDEDVIREEHKEATDKPKVKRPTLSIVK